MAKGRKISADVREEKEGETFLKKAGVAPNVAATVEDFPIDDITEDEYKRLVQLAGRSDTALKNNPNAPIAQKILAYLRKKEVLVSQGGKEVIAKPANPNKRAVFGEAPGLLDNRNFLTKFLQESEALPGFKVEPPAPPPQMATMEEMERFPFKTRAVRVEPGVVEPGEMKPGVAKNVLPEDFVDAFKKKAKSEGFNPEDFFKSPAAVQNGWKQWDQVPASARLQVVMWGNSAADTRTARTARRSMAGAADEPPPSTKTLFELQRQQNERRAKARALPTAETWDELRNRDFREIAKSRLPGGWDEFYDIENIPVSKNKPMWTPVQMKKTAELLALDVALGSPDSPAEPGGNKGRPLTPLAEELDKFYQEHEIAWGPNGTDVERQRVIEQGDRIHGRFFTSGGKPRADVFDIATGALVRRQKKVERDIERRGAALGNKLDDKQLRKLRPVLRDIERAAGIKGMEQWVWKPGTVDSKNVQITSGQWIRKKLNRSQRLELIKQVIKEAGLVKGADLLPQELETGLAPRAKSQLRFLAQLRENDIPLIKEYTQVKIAEHLGHQDPNQEFAKAMGLVKRRVLDPDSPIAETIRRPQLAPGQIKKPTQVFNFVQALAKVLKKGKA